MGNVYHAHDSRLGRDVAIKTLPDHLAQDPAALARFEREARFVDINPFFSPDGREVVYQSDSSGRLELWIARADGSSRRQLTDIGASGHFQRWRPDGWIYFRSQSALMRTRPEGGEPQLVSRSGGAHISFTPDGSRVIDVSGHKVVQAWNASDGTQERFFAFDDSDVRIDYPSLSPDGRWLLFDRFRPEGGDIWLAEGLRRARR